ncbi:MAG TPA: PEGA domain-containing protein [Polyangiaceae bacterium]
MRFRPQHAMAIALIVSVAPAAAAQPRRPAVAPAATPPGNGVKPLSQTLTGEAKSAYDAAKLLLGDGDFAGAAIKFQAAYDQSSDARLLWNIAACEKSQRHYAKTMALVRRYLDSGGSLLTEADRREAKGLIDAIESFTVRLSITVSETGADVYVDDERVGTSPLTQPVTVDIGQRRVTAKKAGFADATQTVPVGGSGAADVSLTLSAEVHEGHLTVTTQADAHILVDGKVVATGKYDGPLKSGGHTLRVEADGMHPYQSELSLSDGENRSVDVPLEKVVAPAAAVEMAPGVEIGITGGPGVKLHGDHPWMTTVQADLGLRLGWVTNFGVFAEYGSIDASGNCGTDAHAASPTSAVDLSVRNSFHSCQYLEAGLQLLIHFLPAHAFDPWIAGQTGARLTFFDFSSFDPLGGSTSHTVTRLPAFDVGGRVGLDWHPVQGFRPWAIGAYASVVYTAIANENPATNAGNDSNAPPATHDPGVSSVSYFSVLFGARTSLAF